MNNKQKRILVVRTDRMGDVILSLPVLSILKREFPESYIAILIQPYTRDILSGNQDIDEVIFDNSKFEFFQMVKEIKRKKFDIAILLHPDLRLAILLFLSRIRIRVGTGYRAYSFLFNRRVYEHRRNSNKHELELNIGLLKGIGIEAKGEAPKVFLQEEAKKWALETIKSMGIQKSESLIILHPGSSGSARNWSLEKFAKLGDKLLEEDGIKVLITGDEREKELISRIYDKMERKPFFIYEGMNIQKLGALIEKSRVFVSNSTGPMHLASALGIKCVAIFCPILSCGPERWGPWGNEHVVFKPDVPTCKKCIKQRCSYCDCMELIKVEDVYQAVMKQIDVLKSII